MTAKFCWNILSIPAPIRRISTTQVTAAPVAEDDDAGADADSGADGHAAKEQKISTAHDPERD